MIFQGIRTNIARIPFIIVIFGVFPDPPAPPPPPHTHTQTTPSVSAHVQGKDTENRHSHNTIKETKPSKMTSKLERTLHVLRNYIAKTMTKHHPSHTDLYRQWQQHDTLHIFSTFSKTSRLKRIEAAPVSTKIDVFCRNFVMAPLKRKQKNREM